MLISACDITEKSEQSLLPHGKAAIRSGSPIEAQYTVPGFVLGEHTTPTEKETDSDGGLPLKPDPHPQVQLETGTKK